MGTVLCFVFPQCVFPLTCFHLNFCLSRVKSQQTGFQGVLFCLRNSRSQSYSCYGIECLVSKSFFETWCVLNSCPFVNEKTHFSRICCFKDFLFKDIFYFRLHTPSSSHSSLLSFLFCLRITHFWSCWVHVL